jgi:hypothetical protein
MAFAAELGHCIVPHGEPGFFTSSWVWFLRRGTPSRDRQKKEVRVRAFQSVRKCGVCVCVCVRVM